MVSSFLNSRGCKCTPLHPLPAPMKMTENKKIKRNHQFLQDEICTVQSIFSIEMHYRTSVLHREIFNHELAKISGKIHCRTNMQKALNYP